MKTSRFLSALVVGALMVASCGGGSGSSDTTERTRNSATTSPFANRVMFVSGETTDGLTKIYQYVFNTAGLPVVTEIFSAPVGGNVGVTDISYSSSGNILYWAMQDGSNLKIMSTSPGAGGTPTTHYTIPGAYPYSLAVDPSDNLVWSGQTTTPQLWWGNIDGRTETVLSSDDVASVVMAPNSQPYGLKVGSASAIFSYRPTFRPRLFHSTGTVVERPILVDTTGNLAYYVTQFSSGTSEIVRTTPRSTAAPVVVATATKRVVSMSTMSDGSLFWADGLRPSMGDPLTPSTITWVSATDPSVTQEIVPDPALSITSIWVVEPPAETTDSAIGGDIIIGGEMYCNPGLGDDDRGFRSSRQYRGIEMQWFRNGEPIPDAVDYHVATEPGRYKCTVSASNIAGLTTLETPEVEVIDPSATTTTIESSGSGSSASSTTVATAPPASVTYKSIQVKWSYSPTARVISGTFKKVAGARTYSMTVTGATKKTVKCTTTTKTVTCRTTLKKGKNLMTVNARNSAKVIVAQRKASKTVK